MKRLLVAAGLLLAAAAQAHEYWLMPTRFAAMPGERIGIAHRVGAGWPGETLPRDPARVRRFGLIDALGERPIAGAAGADPAGRVGLRAPGLAVAVYHSTAAPLVLDAAPFESYLREEGLERIVELRRARGQSAEPGRERFSRHAKTLVAVGTPGGTGGAGGTGGPGNTGGAGGTGAPAGPFDRPAGLELELVPETEPRTIAGGGRFAVRLLHLGRPLAGALVKALPMAEGEARLERRSDGEGRVVFALPRAGVWLLSAVHMVEAPQGSGADWESLWSSLTFELPERAQRGASAPR